MICGEPPSERRWRRAAILLWVICIVCVGIALASTGLLPGNLAWAGFDVPLAIGTLGTLAGVAGCLCLVRLVTLKRL